MSPCLCDEDRKRYYTSTIPIQAAAPITSYNTTASSVPSHRFHRENDTTPPLIVLPSLPTYILPTPSQPTRLPSPPPHSNTIPIPPISPSSLHTTPLLNHPPPNMAKALSSTRPNFLLQHPSPPLPSPPYTHSMKTCPVGSAAHSGVCVLGRGGYATEEGGGCLRRWGWGVCWSC